MQARWIQLPFDPVRGTFDDTPLVRALEERPAAAVREYLYQFDERPHLGCFVQWRHSAVDSGKRRPTDAELDELLRELEAEDDAVPACGLGAFGGLDAIEMRRMSPAGGHGTERGARARRGIGRPPPRTRTSASEDANEADGSATGGRSASSRRHSTGIERSESLLPTEDEPLDGPALRAAEGLRAWRNARRRELDVPAYRVLTNRQLEIIARRRPETLDDLSEIAGLGPATLATHGDAILACLRSAELRAREKEDIDPDSESPMPHTRPELTTDTAKPDANPDQPAGPVSPDASAGSH